MKLTPLKDCIKKHSELTDTTTVGLIQYGLRQGGSIAEYHLANRLQDMRQALFTLAEQSTEKGNGIPQSVLDMLDVEVEVKQMKRFSKKS